MAPAPSRPDADALAAIQMEEHRKKFDSHIAAAEQAQAQSRNGGLMSQARYEGIVSHLRVFDSLPRKERNYSIHQRYRIQLVGATAWLVPRAEANSLEGLKRYVHTGELFEVLLSEHQAIGHAKHETLHKAICKKYVNITRKVGDIFCQCCPGCIRAQPRPPGREGHKPILTHGFGARGQVDLIDMQSCPDGEYKWLLVYVDHGIKWCDVRALKSKKVSVPTKCPRHPLA
jgi:hypothetical protein